MTRYTLRALAAQGRRVAVVDADPPLPRRFETAGRRL